MNDLVKYIDRIDQSVNDSELFVLESLGTVYAKSLVILENCTCDTYHLFDIFQEGELFDKAKGNSNESMIKRILLFIPRLIKALIEKMSKFFNRHKKMTNEIMNAVDKNEKDDKPCHFKVELVTDLNKCLEDLIFNEQDIQTVIYAIDDIDNAISRDIDMNNITKLCNDLKPKILSLINKCKQSTETLSKTISNPIIYTFDSWDTVKEYLEDGINPKSNGLINYLIQMMNDISGTANALLNKVQGRNTDAIDAIVQPMLNLTTTISEFITLYTKGIIEDRSRIYKAMGLDNPDDSMEAQLNELKNRPSGATTRQNNHWDPESVTKVDYGLLIEHRNLIQQYVHNDIFMYYGEYKTPTLPLNVRDNLFKLIYELKRAEYFSDYKNMLEQIFDIFDVKSYDQRVLEIHCDQMKSRGDLMIRFNEPETKTFPNVPGVSLYHTSYQSGLTELKPTFKSDLACFPTERVYFGYNTPITRYGGTLTGDYLKAELVKNKINDRRLYIYKLDQSIIGSIYKDTELRNSPACFITTDRPVRVKDVTDQFIQS